MLEIEIMIRVFNYAQFKVGRPRLCTFLHGSNGLLGVCECLFFLFSAFSIIILY